MGQPKRKTVFSANPEQALAIQVIVDTGRYQSPSELIREAIDDKLAAIRREELARQVARYCDGEAGEDAPELIGWQAFDEER